MQESNFKGSKGSKRYPIRAGLRVFVYRNLNIQHVAEEYRHPVLYSIRAAETVSHEGFDPLRWGTVFHHSPSITLSQCHFLVQPGSDCGSFGWKSVRSTGRKNVHAGVIGRLVDWESAFEPVGSRISYDPHLNDSFIDVATQMPIRHADEVMLFTSLQNGRKTTEICARNAH